MKRATAYLTLRLTPHYRYEAFAAGLERVGFTVSRVRPVLGRQANPTPVKPADVLIVWNRHAADDPLAKLFGDAGGRVLVAENGWIGHDSDGHHLFAICRDHHNGPGSWHVGEEDRWSSLGIDLTPWRANGDEIVILPQRSIGPGGVAMPRGWEHAVAARLKERTDRPIRIRPHPGSPKTNPNTDPMPDLAHAWAAVTWGSGAAIKAIVGGVPVFYELERWIGAPAARFGIDQIEAPYLGDRLAMLRRLAWGQWTADEVARGEPFAWLLKE